MKRTLIALLLLFGTVLSAEIRSISSGEVIYLFEGPASFTVGEVALFDLVEDVQAGFKARYEYIDPWWRVLAGPCLVVVAADNFYYEIFYGFGYDADNAFSHEGTLELNIETDTYMLSAGVKADYFQSNGFFYVIPSAGASWSFTDWYALKVKAFTSFDSESTTSVSALLNNEFKASKELSFQLGATGGFTWAETGDFWSNTVLGNCKVSFTKTASAALTAELLMEEFVPVGVKGILTVDLKF